MRFSLVISDCLLVFLAFSCCEVRGSKILFNGMHASSSHVGSMLPLAVRLAKDGHFVHFLESNVKNESYKYPEGITNTYIKLDEDPILMKMILPAMWTKVYGPGEFPMIWKTGDSALVDMIKHHNDTLDLVRNKKWDLVVADELFAVSSYGLALEQQKQHGAAYVILSTCVSTHLMRWHMSLGSTFWHRPSMFTAIRDYDERSFISRLHSTVHASWIWYGIDKMTTHTAVQGLNLMGIDNFHLSQLAQGSSYYFVDDLNSLVWPYPVAEDHVHVGFTCPSPSPLAQKYKEFVEDPKSKGTILIAFGSNVVWQYVTPQIMKAFVEGINRLKQYRFFFAFNGLPEQVKDFGEHCIVTKWAPQKELLSHNKTKLFISHAGLKSVKDTICAEVPVVYMPLFAEQTHNSVLAKTAGFAEIIDKATISPQSFLEVVTKVIDNNNYKKAVVKTKKFMLDKPATSSDLVSFYSKRAIKYKELFKRAPTFKRKGMYQSTFAFFNCDIFVLGAILAYILSIE